MICYRLRNSHVMVLPSLFVGWQFARGLPCTSNYRPLSVTMKGFKQCWQIVGFFSRANNAMLHSQGFNLLSFCFVLPVREFSRERCILPYPKRLRKWTIVIFAASIVFPYWHDCNSIREPNRLRQLHFFWTNTGLTYSSIEQYSVEAFEFIRSFGRLA